MKRKIILHLILTVLIQHIPFDSLWSNPDNFNEQFIYIRLDISTNSDWTILKWNKFPKIKTMRVFAIEGEEVDFKVSPEQIKLAQTLEKAKTSKIRLIVDYIIEKSNEENWEFILSRGAMGQTEVKILAKKGSIFEKLYSVVHDEVIKKDEAENKSSYQIDLKFNDKCNFNPHEFVRTNIPRLVLAVYYMWYTKNNWQIFPLNDEPLTKYSSDDVKTILKQIKQAKESGIDGFVVSWDKPGSFSDQNFKKFLTLCNQTGFKTSIYFETLAEKNPRNEEEIIHSLKYLIKNYSMNKAFIKIFDKPLIFIYASNHIALKNWKKIFLTLKLEGYQATFIAMGYDVSNLLVFDGIHEYSVINYNSLENVYASYSDIVRKYFLFGEKEKLWVATVQPGYDERKIPARPGFFKSRNSGKYYEDTWKYAIKSNPDIILITSWNEWWENTHIEPSKLYNDLYLKLTRKYSKIWKKK